MLVIARKEFYHTARDLRLFLLVLVALGFLLVALSHVFALDVERGNLSVQTSKVRRSKRLHLSYHRRRRLCGGRVPGAEPGFDAALYAWDCRHGGCHSTWLLIGGCRRGPARVQTAVDGADAIVASRSVSLLESRVAAFVPGLARRVEVVVGKAIPALIVGMLSFGTLLAVTVFGFGIAIRGSLSLLLVLTPVFAVAETGYGTLISGIARTQ